MRATFGWAALAGERSVSTTVKDIARHVGLSVTTVSRALNDHGDVAAATKARIRAVADELDYHPNLAARSLQNSRSETLGLVIPRALHRPNDIFWLEFIAGMESACSRRGFDLLLSATEAEDEESRSLERLVRGRRVDGLVVCDIRTDDRRIRQMQRLKVPFVAFGRNAAETDYNYIDVDGAAGVRDAVQHLIFLGHQRIAYLGLDPRFGFSRFRLDGYRQGLKSAGLPYNPALVREGLTEATAPGAVQELLAHENRPTAMCAAADFLALAILPVAREQGLSIPRDLSVIVFDDNLSVQRADPPLTAIDQPNRRLGEEAATVLLDRVRGPDRPLVQRLFTPTLIFRSSTAAASGAQGGQSETTVA
jgi:DNA-binding LacI/PurR family transcriptional regulator